LSARYAIYLAPSADTALWRLGSQVLGYDAATGLDLPGFMAAGHDAASWSALTARPRLYGFHATLKAPFRLAAAQEGSLPALHRALAAFAAGREAFDLGPLQVSALVEEDAGPRDRAASGFGAHGFVALVQQRPSAALAALESETVAAFEPFRAPLTPEELARRQPERLTLRQRDNLARWGYPHVGADYRFHMTLTGALADPQPVAEALAARYAAAIGDAPLVIDALALFEQPASGARFRIVDRFPFRQAGASHRAA
jgi:hypothetical protein